MEFGPEVTTHSHRYSRVTLTISEFRNRRGAWLAFRVPRKDWLKIVGRAYLPKSY